MMKKLLTIFFPLLLTANCKTFRFGRSIEGNLGAPGNYGGEPLPEAQWFEQKLDHFSPTDLQTWKQRYYVNDSFYEANSSSPAFLMIGGEASLDIRWMIKGSWIVYAKEFGALCVSLEHRFYGESHPTRNMSTKNLAYLSSQQALADIANFITHMNNVYVSKETKWIVFGGSYSGSLAAWMRLKYPHLVHGAVSSSGPLLAEVDFDRYFGVVVEALREKTGNDDCVNQVKKAQEEMQILILSNPRLVERELRLCTPLSEASTDDMKTLSTFIADDFAEVVQYNEVNRISKKSNITIKTVCDLLTGPSSLTAFKKLAKFNSMVLNETNETCLDYNYTILISELRDPYRLKENGRQWVYQMCTEFGFFQTSSAEEDAFGFFPLEFFFKQCQDVFGIKFDDQFIYNSTRWTNTYYGALNISVSNVVFVHGTIDPWHVLGITEKNEHMKEGVGVILINGTSHCANMYPSSPSDLPELRAARVEVASYLRSWLQG